MCARVRPGMQTHNSQRNIRAMSQASGLFQCHPQWSCQVFSTTVGRWSPRASLLQGFVFFVKQWMWGLGFSAGLPVSSVSNGNRGRQTSSTHRAFYGVSHEVWPKQSRCSTARWFPSWIFQPWLGRAIPLKSWICRCRNRGSVGHVFPKVAAVFLIFWSSNSFELSDFMVCPVVVGYGWIWCKAQRPSQPGVQCSVSRPARARRPFIDSTRIPLSAPQWCHEAATPPGQKSKAPNLEQLYYTSRKSYEHLWNIQPHSAAVFGRGHRTTAWNPRKSRSGRCWRVPLRLGAGLDTWRFPKSWGYTQFIYFKSLI